MGFFTRLIGTLRSQSLHEEIAEEQEHHLELAARELHADGLPSDEARRLARLRFGLREESREETRRQDLLPGLEAAVRDIRFAFRGLRRAPVYSIVVLLALGLGIGANTAVYSIVQSVLLRSLPYPDPDRLTFIYTKLASGGRTWANYEDIADWARDSKSFASIAAWVSQTVNLTGVGEPDRLRGGFVSSNFFDMLGIAPMLGRGFLADEVIPNGPRVAIASWGMWQERFGGDPGFLNSKVLLNGEPYVIIGILPKGFDFPFDRHDVWMPYTTWPSYERGRGSVNAGAIGRRRQGVTLSAAQAELNVRIQALAAQLPDTNRQRVGSELLTLQDMLVQDLRPQLLILGGAVLLALLVACANIASLTVARVLSRGRELGIRAALGAGRARLASHLFMEQLLLSCGGAVLGLILAYWLTRLSVVTNVLPPMMAPQVDWSVALACFALAFFTAFFTGPLPALSLLRGKNLDLAKGGRTSSETLSANRTRRMLVTFSVAVSVILLAGAGLLIRSFNTLSGVDIGFDSRNLLTLEYRMPQAKYPKPEQQVEFHRRVAQEAADLAGVRSASVMMALPFSGNGHFSRYHVVGQPPASKGSEPRAQINRVDHGYFETLGIRILSGRVFTPSDGPTSRRVAVVSQSFAERWWPGQGTLQRQVVLFPEVAGDPFTIVGIVADSKHNNLEEESRDKAYVPFAQMPHFFGTLAVKTERDPATYVPAVRQAVWRVDRDQPVWKVRTMESLVNGSISNRRALANSMSIFSVFALLLAAIGLYGVVSYTMSSRAKELGIRSAMGATQARLVKMVFGEGIRNIAIGVAIGLACAIPASRLLHTQLFQIEVTDPEPYIFSVLSLIAAALLATILPARKVAAISPADILRQD